MSLPKLERLAGGGDAGARAALDAFGKQMAGVIENLASIAQEPTIFDQWEAQERAHREAMCRAGEAAAAAKRAEIERQRAMVRDLAAMRHTVERAEAREAAAEDRAQAAEDRERVAAAQAEQRERFMVRVAVTSAAFGFVGAVAAVVAIVS